MRLTINGRERTADVAGDATLLDLLRDTLSLTGTKRVCDEGACGACTVLLDGAPIYSCITLAHGCDGHDVRTIEGLGTQAPQSAQSAHAPRSPHALQEAFAIEDAAQCGFCTPGQLMAAAALLAANPEPSDAEIVAAMSGNLCRCGTYPKIVRAVRRAAATIRESSRGS